MSTQVQTRKFTVEEFLKMVEAGILRDDDRVELVEGEIVEMPPIGGRHAGRVDQLADILKTLAGNRVIVRVQGPAVLGEHTQLQPDLSLLVRRADYYTTATPDPSRDILLVIEVAETSLTYDRRRKGPLYARAGIPEFWIWDLKAKQVHVHREPSPSGYRSVSIRRPGDKLAPLAFPDVELAVGEVLG